MRSSADIWESQSARSLGMIDASQPGTEENQIC